MISRLLIAVLYREDEVERMIWPEEFTCTLAEEVAGIIPQLAEYAKEKDVIPGSTSEKLVPDAVQYSLLSVLLLKELQQQKKQIQKLEEQVRLLTLKKENK